MTVKAIVFQQGNASTHPEKHIQIPYRVKAG